MRHGRHLNADARRAEEIAIHYADVTRGIRSGAYGGPDQYRGARERCLAALARDIAADHGIQPAQVLAAVGRRDHLLDAVVLLLIAALHALAADRFLRRLFATYLPDEIAPALIGAAAGAIGLSAAGVVVGGLSASIVEMIQLGDTHLSYRADRIPWTAHSLPLFAAAIVVFALIATVRWTRAARPSASPSTLSSA
jgi:hypothetical protein